MKFTERLEEMLVTAALADEYEGVDAIRATLEEAQGITDAAFAEVPHAEPGAFQAVKSNIKGHGEQTVLPDDCQFGDNDLCYVDA